MPNGQGFDYSFGHGRLSTTTRISFWQGPNRYDLWRNGKEIFEDGKYFPPNDGRRSRTFIETS